jgi:hypothetical protein
MAEIYFTRTGQTGTPGIQGPAGADAVLPQNLGTSDSPSFDKIYVTNNGNGTNVKIGDDAWIGDVNVANHISIKGFEDATKAGIVLGSGKTEKISSNATDMTLVANNDIILTPGSTYAYLGEVIPDNRIARMVDITNNSAAALQYGSFYDILQQTCTANSIQPMLVRQTQFSNGVSITSNSHININHAGRYNLAFSAQFHQTSNSGLINVWLAKNGVAVDNTNTKITIPSNAPYQVAAWNFFVDSAGSDYYQIMWSSDSNNTVIETVAASGSGASLHPAVPSVILTVNQIGA